MNDETLLTTQELADLTHISRQTYEGWRCRRDGGPPFLKLGAQLVRYRWGDVKAWMAAATVMPTQSER